MTVTTRRASATATKAASATPEHIPEAPKASGKGRAPHKPIAANASGPASSQSGSSTGATATPASATAIEAPRLARRTRVSRPAPRPVSPLTYAQVVSRSPSPVVSSEGATCSDSSPLANKGPVASHSSAVLVPVAPTQGVPKGLQKARTAKSSTPVGTVKTSAATATVDTSAPSAAIAASALTATVRAAAVVAKAKANSKVSAGVRAPAASPAVSRPMRTRGRAQAAATPAPIPDVIIKVNTKRTVKKPVIPDIQEGPELRAGRRTGRPIVAPVSAPAAPSTSSQDSSASLAATYSAESPSPVATPHARTPAASLLAIRNAKARKPGRMSTGGKAPRSQRLTIVTADVDMEDVHPEQRLLPQPALADIFADDNHLLLSDDRAAQLDVDVDADDEHDLVDTENAQLSDGLLPDDMPMDIDDDALEASGDDAFSDFAGFSDSMAPVLDPAAPVPMADNAANLGNDDANGSDDDAVSAGYHREPPPSTQPGSKRSHQRAESQSDDEPPKKRRSATGKGKAVDRPQSSLVYVDHDDAPEPQSNGEHPAQQLTDANPDDVDDTTEDVVPVEPAYNEVLRKDLQEPLLQGTYHNLPPREHSPLIGLWSSVQIAILDNGMYPKVIKSDIVKVITFSSHATSNIFNPARANLDLYSTRTTGLYTDIIRKGASRLDKLALSVMPGILAFSTLNFPVVANDKLTASVSMYPISQEIELAAAAYDRLVGPNLTPIFGVEGTFKFGTYSVPAGSTPSSSQSQPTARPLDKSLLVTSSATMKQNESCNMLYQRRTLAADTKIPVFDATRRFKSGSKDRDPLWREPIPPLSLCLFMHTVTASQSKRAEGNRLLSCNISGIIILVIPKGSE
ncbi:hypothetical protein FA95DRAFT_1613029 [Auriscalpium vulgare]|uniref:Uncharacterized protein n=1 Tax=Auriscalpium vulgare TaxID=40419 RepID=A0ACB8R4R9_9AGAM|nr:hypothetical protein FA95DRAFT_1613029 [Auriscalpium vulgare]